MSEVSVFRRYIDEASALLQFVFREDGLLVGANRSATTLLPIEVGKTRLEQVLVGFTQHPTLASLKTDGSERYLFTVEAGELPMTLWFRFYEEAEGIVAFAELDYEEVRTMDKTLVRTNQELSNLARELERKSVNLERAVKERNQVVGIVAHDLRTPIGNVQNLAMMLKEDLAEQIDPDSEELFDLIIAQSEYMRSMLEGILDLSAIESGELRLNIESIALKEVLEETYNLHRMQAEAKGIALRLEIEPDLPALQGDRSKLIQLFSNLVANALKFSEAETCVLLESHAGESALHVSVKDQGPGIPDDERSKMFKPFSRLSTRPTAGESSTGLGLAIVRRIVEAHHGKIEVASTIGEGTTMHVELPLSIDRPRHETC